MITVISRYVEIDASSVEVNFSQSKRESRLVVDIPVVGPAGQSASRRATTRAGSRY
jgi:septum formation topological specificity factor MinE